MTDLPFLPLWTDAYLADTSHLTLEEHGAYLKILMISWRSPDCQMDATDERIAVMLGITRRRWREKLRPVLEPFFSISGTVWCQKRLQNEFIDRSKRRTKHAAKSSKGGKAKALKNNKTVLPQAPSGQATGSAQPIAARARAIAREEDVPAEHRADTPFGHELQASTWELGAKIFGRGAMVGKALKAGMVEEDIVRALNDCAGKANPSAYFGAIIRDYEGPTPKLSATDQEEIARKAQSMRELEEGEGLFG